MYTEMFEKTNAQVEQMLNPVRKAQSSMLDHVARLADFQVEAVKHYSELSIDNLRALKDINDPQSLQAYVTKQTEVAKSLGEKVTADMNEFVKINRGFAEELQKLAQDGVTAASEQAKQQTKQAVSAVENASASAAKETGAASSSSSSSSSKKSA
ncbi:TIGR01841 family phasin [Aquisalimonas asiatica]|uniref:Phasin family protein n=1 Tax=Aquisalimonas asiatica TaxID=406100 RepID=A0A1H8U290_9GAMM|nr:TIGR01841 family phasin [Aquisalimonas asiatica]SEO97235.1 phasin family protein [Aquisalimonas asiatica]